MSEISGAILPTFQLVLDETHVGYVSIIPCVNLLYFLYNHMHACKEELSGEELPSDQEATIDNNDIHLLNPMIA